MVGILPVRDFLERRKKELETALVQRNQSIAVLQVELKEHSTDAAKLSGALAEIGYMITNLTEDTVEPGEASPLEES